MLCMARHPVQLFTRRALPELVSTEHATAQASETTIIAETLTAKESYGR